MRTFFAFFVLGIFVFAGCRTSTSPGTSTGAPITAPKAGSYFVLQNTELNSMGTVTYMDTTMETFLQTGLTIGGKTNVDELVDSTNGGFSDSGYIHYESNGDVTVLYPSDSIRGIFGTWLTYPFGTQGTFTYSIDTVLFGLKVHSVMTLSGAGTGSTTIKGISYPTEKVTARLYDISSSSYGGNTFSDTLDEIGTASFAASLGDVIYDNDAITETSLGTGSMKFSDQQIAIDFLLK